MLAEDIKEGLPVHGVGEHEPGGGGEPVHGGDGKALHGGGGEHELVVMMVVIVPFFSESRAFLRSDRVMQT